MCLTPVALLAQAFNPADWRSPNVERGNSRASPTLIFMQTTLIVRVEHSETISTGNIEAWVEHMLSPQCLPVNDINPQAAEIVEDNIQNVTVEPR